MVSKRWRTKRIASSSLQIEEIRLYILEHLLPPDQMRFLLALGASARHLLPAARAQMIKYYSIDPRSYRNYELFFRFGVIHSCVVKYKFSFSRLSDYDLWVSPFYAHVVQIRLSGDRDSIDLTILYQYIWETFRKTADKVATPLDLYDGPRGFERSSWNMARILNRGLQPHPSKKTF